MRVIDGALHLPRRRPCKYVINSFPRQPYMDIDSVLSPTVKSFRETASVRFKNTFVNNPCEA